jgi:hypothetical protein
METYPEAVGVDPRAMEAHPGETKLTLESWRLILQQWRLTLEV